MLLNPVFTLFVYVELVILAMLLEEVSCECDSCRTLFSSRLARQPFTRAVLCTAHPSRQFSTYILLIFERTQGTSGSMELVLGVTDHSSTRRLKERKANQTKKQQTLTILSKPSIEHNSEEFTLTRPSSCEYIKPCLFRMCKQQSKHDPVQCQADFDLMRATNASLIVGTAVTMQKHNFLN